MKKIFRFWLFCGDIISGVSSVMPFWLTLPGPGPKLLDGI